MTDPEDVLDAESRVVDAGPRGCEVIPERVLGVSATGVDGDVLVVTRSPQGPDQRSRIALVDDDVHMSSATLAQVRLQLCYCVSLVPRCLHKRIL